jgi:hypothetical protein
MIRKISSLRSSITTTSDITFLFVYAIITSFDAVTATLNTTAASKQVNDIAIDDQPTPPNIKYSDPLAVVSWMKIYDSLSRMLMLLASWSVPGHVEVSSVCNSESLLQRSVGQNVPDVRFNFFAEDVQRPSEKLD